MSLKKLAGVSAWVLLSGLFFTGPILLAEGVLPSWSGIPISLIPCLAIILSLLTLIKTNKGKYVLVMATSIAIYWFNHINLLKPENIFLANFTVINGLLFWMFGRTLRSDSIPLCTRFANLVHEIMSPEVIAYTRSLTYVWAAFFAIQALLCMALFAILPSQTWYRLITVVPPALIVILFAFDWIARQFMLPDEDKKDALQLTIRAIIKHHQALGKAISK